MEWDEPRPGARAPASLGDNLKTLSVAELEQRITAFAEEIERVKAELARKRAHENAANAIFKSKDG